MYKKLNVGMVEHVLLVTMQEMLQRSTVIAYPVCTGKCVGAAIGWTNGWLPRLPRASVCFLCAKAMLLYELVDVRLYRE